MSTWDSPIEIRVKSLSLAPSSARNDLAALSEVLRLKSQYVLILSLEVSSHVVVVNAFLTSAPLLHLLLFGLVFNEGLQFGVHTCEVVLVKLRKLPICRSYIHFFYCL